MRILAFLTTWTVTNKERLAEQRLQRHGVRPAASVEPRREGYGGRFGRCEGCDVQGRGGAQHGTGNKSGAACIPLARTRVAGRLRPAARRRSGVFGGTSVLLQVGQTKRPSAGTCTGSPADAVVQ